MRLGTVVTSSRTMAEEKYGRRFLRRLRAACRGAGMRMMRAIAVRSHVRCRLKTEVICSSASTLPLKLRGD